MIKITLSKDFQRVIASMPRAHAHLSKVMQDTTLKLSAKTYTELKINTLFNTPRSEGKLNRNVKASVKYFGYKNTVKVYISKTKETQHIAATEFGFSDTSKLIHAKVTSMKIMASTLKYNIGRQPYLYLKTVKRGAYAGKFMFNKTYTELIQYTEKQFIYNPNFHNKLSKAVLGV